MYFARELRKREPNEPNPFYNVKSEEDDDGGENEQEKTPEPGNEKPEQLELNNYFTFPLETRVHLLHILCEVQHRKYACSALLEYNYLPCKSGNWTMRKDSVSIWTTKPTLCIGYV